MTHRRSIREKKKKKKLLCKSMFVFKLLTATNNDVKASIISNINQSMILKWKSLWKFKLERKRWSIKIWSRNSKFHSCFHLTSDTKVYLSGGWIWNRICWSKCGIQLNQWRWYHLYVSRQWPLLESHIDVHESIELVNMRSNITNYSMWSVQLLQHQQLQHHAHVVTNV